MASSINASTSGAGGVITTADNTGILNLQTGGTTAVTVDASQNVGIGTTSPTAKLEASGSGNTRIYATSTGTSSTFPGFIVKAGTQGNLEVVQNSGNGEAYFYNVANAAMTFATNNTERMRIASNGSREFSDSLGGIQYGEGTASWANVSSIAINLATVFPNISFTSKSISVQMQTLTNSSGAAATTQLTLLLRRSDSTWATATSVANITSGGTTISAAGSGTTVTLTFGVGGQFGLTRINILTQA